MGANVDSDLDKLVTYDNRSLAALSAEVREWIYQHRTVDPRANVLAWLLEALERGIARKCPTMDDIYAMRSNPTCCKACSLGCVCGPDVTSGGCANARSGKGCSCNG